MTAAAWVGLVVGSIGLVVGAAYGAYRLVIRGCNCRACVARRGGRSDA